MKVIASIQRFLNDEEGASGIEYALIAGVVAVALTASSDTIRTAIKDIMGAVNTKLVTAATEAKK
ncbi:MAG: Flp/Fap pilin component [Pseudomonadota bacterium]|jgi:pilus assembly protein Flp/PilA